MILLPKPGKPLDEVAKRRDIFLQPHGLKLLMNAVKPVYDEVARGAQPASNAGFRERRRRARAGLYEGMGAVQIGMLRGRPAVPRTPAGPGVVDVRVHVTRGGLDAVPPELRELSHVSVVAGRPALGEIVQGVVRRRMQGADARGDVNAALRLAEGAGFEFACGPARLQTELATLCKRHGFSRIHTETFEF